MVNNTTTAKFLGQSVTGGASAFTNLTDVPAAYTGQGGKVVSVKADVSGLEFTAATGTDEKVKYDAGDPTAGYVADKIIAGTGITVAEGSGGNENKLVVTATYTGADKVSRSGDTMTGELILKTGTNTVAPLLFVSGTNLTTPVAGTMEFDGTDLFISI